MAELESLKSRLARLGVQVNEFDDARQAPAASARNSAPSPGRSVSVSSMNIGIIRPTHAKHGHATTEIAPLPNIACQAKARPNASKAGGLSTNIRPHGKREVADLLDKISRVEVAINTAETLTNAAQQKVEAELGRALDAPDPSLRSPKR